MPLAAPTAGWGAGAPPRFCRPRAVARTTGAFHCSGARGFDSGSAYKARSAFLSAMKAACALRSSDSSFRRPQRNIKPKRPG